MPAHAGKALIARTTDSAIWRIDENRKAVQLQNVGAPIARITTAMKAALVGVGYANGDIAVIDGDSLKRVVVLRASQAARDIALTTDGHMIAIANSDEIVHVGYSPRGSLVDGHINWSTFKARAAKIALASDGLLVALSADGTIWLYSAMSHTALYLATGTADLNLVALSADEKTAAAFDTDGRIIVLDLERARRSMLEKASNTLQEGTGR